MALRLSKRKRPREEDKQVKERNLIAHRVFDDKTVEVLLHFLNKGVFSSLDYPISSGKESIVFRATAPDGFVAVKIFKYETSAFRKFREYIQGDPRFAPKNSLRGYVDLWAKKEFANLRAATDAGVRVPKPLFHKANVVVMEFVGQGGIAYPILEQAHLEDPAAVMDDLVRGARLAYQEAKLVHADLSGFNVLAATEPVIIDWGQAVVRRHPRAEEFLERDCRNLCQFFRRRGVDCNPLDVLAKIRN